MTKTIINTLIRNMQQAGIVTKASPWMIEGAGNKQLNVRYVGVKPIDWSEIMRPENNLLIKFILDGKLGLVEFYLANLPPFTRISGTKLVDTSKWETLLGNLKLQLKKDKEAVIHHRDNVGNLYRLIEKLLK
jgi:hypothetical protein